MNERLSEAFVNTKVEFIVTELKTGLLFADLALQASKIGDNDSRDRNSENAWKAYETARYFFAKGLKLDATQIRTILDAMEALTETIRAWTKS